MTEIAAIKDIAEIRTGYTFRRGEPRHGHYKLLGLHISDIRHSRLIDHEALHPILWDAKGLPPVLEPGEVVLAAKGNYNPAALYEGPQYRVVPSSQFLILTIKTRARERLSPAYLCWVLNYAPTQRRMTDTQTGTNIPSVSKRALGDIEMPVPSLAQQEKILQLQAIGDAQRDAMNALITNNENMLNGMFQQLINGVTK